jgi:hypothetical protein
MKVQLFDDDDLKNFEDHVVRALVRALRIVMKEGTIPGYKPPAPEVFAEAPPPAAPIEEPPPFGARMGEPQSGHSYSQQYAERNGTKPHPIAAAIIPHPEPQPPPDPDLRKNRSMNDYCASTRSKPPGYVTTEQAYDLMEMTRDTAKSYLRSWIFAGVVRGIVLHGSGLTPTKGLGGGRLMVSSEDVKRRDALRKENAATMALTGAGAGLMKRQAA